MYVLHTLPDTNERSTSISTKDIHTIENMNIGVSIRMAHIHYTETDN